ncbi:MAG: BrnT family toxin, partial [Dolichospermum sp.]
MNFVYKNQGIEFECNINKSESYFIKHSVRFEVAVEVFFEPFSQDGDASDNNENRDFILGFSLSQRLLLVVYVDRK